MPMIPVATRGVGPPSRTGVRDPRDRRLHRGAEVTGDISADLDALAHHPVVTVCADAKAFVDLPRSLEYLATAGVPVLGWRHDWPPWLLRPTQRTAGSHRVETAAEVAEVLSRQPRQHKQQLVRAGHGSNSR
jgi:pseudouridine-5'-phosphate glycosidase